jgi:nucleotide-binding universal stress UspA family protein
LFKEILVPVDLDIPATWTAAESVVRMLAARFSSHVTLCSVLRTSDALRESEWLPISHQQLLFEAHCKLQQIASASGLTQDIEVGTGTVSGGVLDIANRIDADLIVLASHQPELVDRIMAANAVRIARRASCSVLIARGNFVEARDDEKPLGPLGKSPVN